jgi:hypothetical protein
VNSRQNNLGHGSEETGDAFYKSPHLTNAEAQAIFSVLPSKAQLRQIARFVWKS